MKTIIDELSLKIDIKTKKDIDKTISSIASAINKLNNAVSNVSNLRKYVNTLNSLTRKTFKVSDGTTKKKGVGNVKPPETTEVSSGLEEVKQQGKEKEKIQKQQQRLAELERKKEERERKKAEQKRKQEKKDLKKSFNKVTSGLRRIGRVGAYRVVRFALSQIVKSVTEGLQNLRATDTQLDLTLKKSSQAVTSLRNSFASLLVPIITLLEPALTKLADTFANIANQQAEARAALSGATEYTKILTSDSKEYKNNLEAATATLLDFDKFSSLSKDSGYTGTVKSAVTMSKEEAQEQVNNYQNVINNLKTLLGIVTAIVGVSFIAKFIKPLWLGIKGIGTVLEKTGGIFKKFSSTTGLLTLGIGSLITGVVTLISNWDKMGETGRWLVPTLSLVAGAIVAVAVALHLARAGVGDLTAWAKGLAIGGIVTGAGLTVGSTLSAATGFADGGVPKRGTYFYAGEAGAEIVANTSGGKTGVTNIAQFKTAMVQALAEYGVARNGRTSDTVLQVNGKEFARATANDMASALSQKYRVSFQPR